ncbi:MAG: nucleotidyl transferase AbiEii/AbiGii toxin family protein [Roseburia sp.]|nr:nucleotidyl transferase AbiEii/AbiGii toxin family protein [Roseburia sp.]MCM1557141.1 nucleotidyl transferase AbiEii/AbiGii toxin family protein [Anaeroplasma bactoclasticum]
MRLHLDKEAFALIIENISSKHSIRRDILEKDYYVTLLLKELSEKDNQLFAYFKGGTALYKALKSIRRFSEDIDLTVFIGNCSTTNQAKKRLEAATLKYTYLTRGEILERRKGTITCEYLYDSLFTLDETDILQRFGRVKVEATNFTISEPLELISIAPHLYELATDEQKKILADSYEVAPFEIETISLERIFIDKVFAAQFYYERKMFRDVAKHIYDLTVLLNKKKIQEFLKEKDRFLYTVSLKRKEELNRKGGINSQIEVSDFPYLTELHNDQAFEKEFKEMQKIYVFNKNDIISKDAAIKAISSLKEIMNFNM